MELQCNYCKSSNLRAMKLGGRLFNLVQKEKPISLRMGGFEPEAWVCKDCLHIMFFMKPGDMEFMNEEDED